MKLVRCFLDAIKLLYDMYLHHVDPVGHARRSGVKVGQDCRLIGVNFGSEPYLVTLGDHVSATRAYFVTHDGSVWVFRDQDPDMDVFGPIKVGNNVFIGLNAIIMPGVTIADNVVIGAGAVVTRDIPSNCVAVGVPAKPIKSVDEYRASLAGKTVPTKGLGRQAKQAYLTKHFSEAEQTPVSEGSAS